MDIDFKIESGGILPARPCGRSAAEQRAIHKQGAIDSATDSADPILALMPGVYAIGDALRRQYPGFGAVITSQSITVIKDSEIGSPAFIRGEVTSFEPESRGAIFTTMIVLTGDNQESLAEMTTTMILIDPAGPPSAKRTTAPMAGEPPAPKLAEKIGSFVFTPEIVRQFEIGYPASIHTDPAVAQSAGFPKPIVAGNQVFSMIWKRFIEPRYLLPVTLNFSLKRPIFWDEEIIFERRIDKSGEHETIEVKRADTKPAIECEIVGVLI
jgi:hypothetical protein